MKNLYLYLIVFLITKSAQFTFFKSILPVFYPFNVVTDSCIFDEIM